MVSKQDILRRGGYVLVALLAFLLGYAGLDFFALRPEPGRARDGIARVEQAMSADFSQEPRIEGAVKLPLRFIYEVGVAFLDSYDPERYQVTIESMEHSLGYNGADGDYLLMKGRIAVLRAGGAHAPPHLLFFGRDIPPDGLLGATYHTDTLQPLGADRTILKDGAEFAVFWVCRLSSRTGHVLKRLADSELLVSVGSALGGGGHDGGGASLTYIEVEGQRLDFDTFERYSTNPAFQSLEFAHKNSKNVAWMPLSGAWRRLAWRSIRNWARKPVAGLAGLLGHREGVYETSETVRIGNRELSLSRVEFQKEPGGILMPGVKGVAFVNITLTLRVLDGIDATPVVIDHHAFQVADRSSGYVTQHVYIPRLGNQLLSTILYPGGELTRCLVFPVPEKARELQMLVDSGNLFGRRVIVNMTRPVPVMKSEQNQDYSTTKGTKVHEVRRQ